MFMLKKVYEYMHEEFFHFFFVILFFTFFCWHSESIVLFVIVEFIWNLFLKMIDVANPEIIVKTGALLIFFFKTFLMHMNEFISGWNMWDGRLKRFERKLGSHNLTYVIIHMPFENVMHREKWNLPQFCEWLICRVKWGLIGATLYREKFASLKGKINENCPNLYVQGEG